jgi:heme exporter protein A
MMMTGLKLQNLTLRRGGRLLFSGLELDLKPGQIAALTGRNGAGKTSLLRAVAGLVQPEAGTIRFGDVDPDEARASGLHLVGHQDGLKTSRTVAEELIFWSRWFGADRARALDSAARLDLTGLLGLEVRRLSAGQRKRLALARLLAAPRPLWLLDEPLSPLDASWRIRFGELMSEHLSGGGLILAAVHDPLPIPSIGLEIGA